MLLSQAPSSELGERIGAFISLLWDVGLEIGHSVRTVDECLSEASGDITIETNLLENRLIAGDAAPWRRLSALLERQRDPLAFFEGKTLEQQQRHTRHFGVGNNLEPQGKPGRAARSAHILWISKAIGLGDNWDALVRRGILTLAEARLIKHSERQLLSLRIELHLLARRREDRLIFDLQQQLGRAGPAGHAGQARQRAMQLYYRAAKTVNQLNGILPNLRGRIYSQVPRVTQNLNERFYSVNGMLGIRQPMCSKTPVRDSGSLPDLAAPPELSGFAPRMLRARCTRSHINERFRANPRNRELFLQMFREPNGLTRGLRRMNLYGVLGRYLQFRPHRRPDAARSVPRLHRGRTHPDGGAQSAPLR